MADSRLMFDIFAVDRASKTFDRIGEHANKMGDHFGKVGKVAALMGKAVAGAAIFGVGALAGAFAEGLKQAADYQKITAQTGAVLKSTGGAAHVSAAHVTELAKSIEEYSTFSDEAVAKGENLLLTFTNIQNKAGKGNDIFDQSTKALYDMAQALGEDPQKAAIQLGKALNDPVKGITALKRVGVSFSEGQKKVIEHLVKTGHTVQAQKLILAELTKEFGGSAKAAGSTFAGSMTRLKNTLMDVLRDAVLPLLPGLIKLADWLGPKLVAGVQFVTRAVSVFVAGFTNNTDQLISLGVQWTDPFVNAGFAVREAFNKILPVIKQVWGWVKTQLAPALQHLGEQVFPALKNAVSSITTTLIKHKDVFIFLGMVLTKIILPVVGQVAKAVLNVLGPAFKVIAWVASNLVIPALKQLIRFWLTMVGAIVNGAAAAFGWIPGLGPKLKKARDDFNKFRIGVNAALSGINDQTVNLKLVASINGSTLMTNQQKKNALDRIFRAAGGPVQAGHPYIVGEEGPELFVPGQSGGIVPNGKGSKASGMSGGDFAVSAPLVIKLDTGIIWQGLVTMKRRRGITTLGLA